MQIRSAYNLFADFSESVSKPQQLIQFQIKNRLSPGSYYDKYIAELQQVDAQKVDYHILVKIPVEWNYHLSPGTLVTYKLSSGDWQSLPQPAYPYAFDYGHYLIKKRIFSQLRIKDTLHILKKKLTGTPFLSPYFLKEKIRAYWINNGMDSISMSIASALFLGERQWLDRDIKQSYVDSGIVHVLAISGMHIGILLLFLRFLFGFIRSRNQFIFNVIVLGFLWGFAWLTGFPPSVLRAVIMFSLLQWALESKRKVSMFYIMLLAAGIILIIDPMFLFDVGFQLSFAAVSSILLFMPLMYKIYKPKTKIFSYVIDLIYISIAAQIGVLPLILLYFHRFSFLFLVSNLLVIPLLTVILAVGFLSIPLAVFNVPFPFLIALLNHLMHLKIFIIKGISKYSFGIADKIYFSPVLASGLFVLLLGIYLLLKKLSHRNFIYFLFTLSIFQILLLWDKYKIYTSHQVLLSDTYGGSALIEKTAHHLQVFTNDSIMFKHVIYDYESRAGVKYVNKNDWNLLYQIGNRKLLVLDSSSIYIPIQVNDLFLTDNPRVHLDKVLNDLRPERVIIGKRNYKFLSDQWKKTLERRGIPYTDLSKQAYIRF